VQPIVDEHRNRLVELFRPHPVQRVAVFGSSVRDGCYSSAGGADQLVEVELLSGLDYAANFRGELQK
jgi:predicted nucleotidyltransferase